MRYRVFLFKSSLYDSGIVTDEQIEALSEALGSYRLEQIRVFQCMDVGLNEPLYDLHRGLGDKAKVVLHHLPSQYDDQCGWIDVVTNFSHAEEVFPTICEVADRYGLHVYDAERDQFISNSQADKTFIHMGMYIETRMPYIRKEIGAVWRVQKIPLPAPLRYSLTGFVVTLLRNGTQTFDRRVQLFSECLERHLNSDEELIGKDRSFVISDGQYSISFVLEGYKKFANMTGFSEDGVLHSDLLRRMNGFKAFKRYEYASEAVKQSITEKMGCPERIAAYPNPADRFVKLIKEHGLFRP